MGIDDMDERLLWLEARIRGAVPLKPGVDRFARMMEDEENARLFADFLDSADVRRLFVMVDKRDELVASLAVPGQPAPSKCIYFVKKAHGVMAVETMDDEVVFGDFNAAPLETLSVLAQEVFLPLLSNPANQEGWPEQVTRDVMDSFHKFIGNVYVTIGQTQGRTLLPLPPAENSAARDKDRIHVLESAVVTWSRQIKGVLKMDPEQVLKTGANPGPLTELDFWGVRAANLNSIHEQLQGDKIRKVTRVLDVTKNSMYPSFNRLCKEVQQARLEANDNRKYLETLRPLLSALANETRFSNVADLFRPIMHLVLLIWKHSRFYNTPSRLVILMREVCNELIRKSSEFIDGHTIFSNDPQTGVDRVKLCLKVCGTFKSCYFDVKARANIEVPNNPWRIQNSALFIRLDSFLERCHDILDLMQTIVQFSRLEKIEIGGTKGRALSTSVRQIFSDFVNEVKRFDNVPYDVLDVGEKTFDDHFYEFRSSIKELERRLSSVMQQALDDTPSVDAAFKLLDSFEGIIERDLISQNLQKTYAALMEQFVADLREVKRVYAAKKDNPPMHDNLPPLAGGVVWCRGLLERVQGPMAKFRDFYRGSLESDEAKDILELYDSIVADVEAHAEEMYNAWTADIDNKAQEKLKQSLLRKQIVGENGEDEDGEGEGEEGTVDGQSRRESMADTAGDAASVASGAATGGAPSEVREQGSNENLAADAAALDKDADAATVAEDEAGEKRSVVRVNFDPTLVRLLREVKYLQKLKLDVPEAAAAIFKKAEIFRTQIGNLDLIVNKYNSMQASVLDVERPLFTTRFEEIETTLEKGLTSLNWKSHGISDFISSAMTSVKGASGVLTTIKDGVAGIEAILERWGQHLLINRIPSKTYVPDEFHAHHEAYTAARHSEVTEGGIEIHQFIHQMNRACQVSKTAPAWKNYLAYVNDQLVNGLTRHVQSSIAYMRDQVDPNYLEKNDVVPLLEIKLELVAPDVLFVPDLDESGGRIGVQDHVNNWINAFFDIGRIFKRIDGRDGDYVEELRTHPAIVALVQETNDLIDFNEDRCWEEREKYLAFSFLWTRNIGAHFEEFLNEHRYGPDGTEQDMPPLDAFDREIAHYKSVQEDIGQMPNSISIGWLKIDSKPVKQALSTWASKWVFVYTHFLASRVSTAVNELDEFIRLASSGLTRDVGAADVEGLQVVLGHLRDIRKREVDVDAMFGPLGEIVSLLQRHGMSPPEDVTRRLGELPTRWSALKRTALDSRSRINKLQTQQGEQIAGQYNEFVSQVAGSRQAFVNEAPFDYHTDVPRAMAAIQAQNQALRAVESEAERFAELQDLFELTVTELTDLTKSRRELLWLKNVWDINAIVLSHFNRWRTVAWNDFDCDRWYDETGLMLRDVNALPTQARDFAVTQALRDAVRDMRASLPLIQQLTATAMRDRHWKQLLRVTGGSIEYEVETHLSFGDLLGLKLHNFADEALAVFERATKELQIERTLESIEQVWSSTSLNFQPFVGQDDVRVLAPIDAIVEQVDDHQLALQKIQVGKYVGNFADDVARWMTVLQRTEAVLSVIWDVQRTWSDLVNLFRGSEDMRQQLPEDAARFDAADSDWREILTHAQGNANVVDVCTGVRGLLERLTKVLATLERCQKALSGFLESKRRAFPRFYLISSQDLLDILSKGNGELESICNKYLSKLFDSVGKLAFETQSNQMLAVGMYSTEGEYVAFQAPYPCQGAVELWFRGLVSAVRSTMKNILNEAVSSYMDVPREQWIFNFCSQVVQTGSQVYWTSEVDTEFGRLENGAESAMRDQLSKQEANLEQLTELVQGELTRTDRSKLASLLTLDVHARDIVAKFVDTGVESASSFEWQSQLRYHWDDDERTCDVLIADARFQYANEYIGNSRRLVITPLTDRCYITLTQAVTMGMGGAPAGPAGTGKTETTKDLAHSLGLPSVVINCSPEIDYTTMAGILKGIASAGPWVCFDEFNRLTVEVLSVVSTQFKHILQAISHRRADAANSPDTFTFEGESLSLASTGGAFATMNPGYAGRQELPESIKVLFRPVSMVVPDILNIVEILLFAEGFSTAKDLSVKFVTLFRLSARLLSNASHYDWGLRAVKPVLTIAGRLKRADPAAAEAELLKRALRDSNLPKIVADDVPIFLGLVDDLLPDLDVDEKADPEVVAAVEAAAQRAGLQPEATFVAKCRQLHELLEVRHSVFIIGPAGSGKTACWKTLANAQTTDLGCETVSQIVNPKAVTPNELYGSLHPTTREWHDGLFSNIMRSYAAQTNGEAGDSMARWVVFDGDIDPEWIESLNSVMDDNKILTLASNERITLTPAMRLLFEIADLDNATPATVSRAGIIFLNESDVGWLPVATSWVAARFPDGQAMQDAVLGLFTRYVPTTLAYLRQLKSFVVDRPDAALVKSLCAILDVLLDDLAVAEKQRARGPATGQAAGGDDGGDAIDRDALESVFQFATVWGLGGSVADSNGSDGRDSFSRFWFKTFEKRMPDTGDQVYDFYYDPAARQMRNWSVQVDADVYAETDVVSTMDSARIGFFLDRLVGAGVPVLLAGGPGTGKSHLIKQIVGAPTDERAFATVSLNGFSTSAGLQTVMEARLEKKAGHVHGPAGSKKLLFFLDDLNVPLRDEYGTQSTEALLRQHMDHGFMYDRVKMTAKDVIDVSYVAALNPNASDVQVSQRLLRHFVALNVPFPNQEAMEAIVGSVVNAHLMYFDQAVHSTIDPIVRGTIDLLKTVAHAFLPTAAKPHYQFNLRELMMVAHGLTFARPEVFSSAFSVMRLWVHECQRVFGDRMTTESDQMRFGDLLNEVARRYLDNDSAEDPLADDILFTTFAVGAVKDPALVATDDSTGSGATFHPVKNVDEMRAQLETALGEHNEAHASMDLVLFDAAVGHVARIARIIATHGHALVVGVGGSGKQSLSRLAAFVCGLEVTTISASADYTVSQFREDLKPLILRAGTKRQDAVMLLTDGQIVDEGMLADVNDLLATGDVPNLFSAEEQSDVCNAVRLAVKQSGLIDSMDNCWRYFVEQVRTHLHFVLCMSPTHSAFRTRLRYFPAILASTAIDWFHAWPEEALVDVATRFLADLDLGSDDLRENIIAHMAFVHKSAGDACDAYRVTDRRHVYTTPKSFLELIHLYRQLLTRKRSEHDQLAERLLSGLDKMKEAKEAVGIMTQLLTKESALADEKKAAAETLLVQLGQDQSISEEQRQLSEKEEAKLAVAAAEVEAFQQACQKDLEEAEPVLNRAEAALNVLDKNSLTELKSFSKPSQDVVNVTNAVMILTSPAKGVTKDLTWAAAKKTMAQIDRFLASLRAFDKDNIPPANIKALEPYLRNPDFTPETMKAKSNAAAGLCEWIINIVAYHQIYLKVEPKRQQLADANRRLDMAAANLQAMKDKVNDLQSRLKSLTDNFEAATQDKNRVLQQQEKLRERIQLSDRLLNGLASENTRWREQYETMEADKATLQGDVLLAASFVSYAGAFSAQYREDLVQNKWLPDLEIRAVPVTENLEVVDILADETRVSLWNNEGLPADPVSAENGAVLSLCSRWPLIIDPQLQGLSWIKNSELAKPVEKKKVAARGSQRQLPGTERSGAGEMTPRTGDKAGAAAGDDDAMSVAPSMVPGNEKDHRRHAVSRMDSVQSVIGAGSSRAAMNAAMAVPHEQIAVVQTTQPHFVLVMERALTAGTTVIVENVGEDIDPILNPVLARSTYKRGRMTYIQFNGKELPYDQGFKLILQTRLANPHYKPEVIAQVTLINFTVTASGLEDQLLAFVMGREQAELEQERSELLTNQREIKIRLAQLEADLLTALSTATGDILDNTDLIASLENTKKTALEISETLERSKETEKALNETRENYRAVAARGSLLYFLLTDMRNLNSVYQYSLATFMRIFDVGMGRAAPADDAAQRVTNLIDAIMLQAFGYVNNGLFARDRLIFSFQLCLKVAELDGELDEDEFEFLVRGPKEFGDENPLSDWLSLQAWNSVIALSSIRTFADLPSDMESSPMRFKDWCDLEHPEDERLPLEWKSLNSFQKLLVVRALRPDRLMVAVAKWVSDKLGAHFVGGSSAGKLDLAAEIKESAGPATPILFLLSPGVNPLNDVEAAAAREQRTEDNERFVVVAMGGGQEVVAERALAVAAETGGWVFLQNIELTSRWLAGLEERLVQLAASAHGDFRVFLSAAPSDFLPDGLLQMALKVTLEPPSGLRANLERAWLSFDEEAINANSKSLEYRTILFALAFLHAVLVERKKFGTLGWNKDYGFNEGDLADSAELIGRYLDHNRIVPWADIRYMVAAILYGGHISDNWDRRLCHSYVDTFLREELMDGIDLMPNGLFASPTNLSHERVLEFIEANLPAEGPACYGLSPSAEIEYQTQQAETLLRSVVDLAPQLGGSAGAASEELVKMVLDDVMERLPMTFDVDSVDAKVTDEERLSPYYNVFIKELLAMNELVVVVRKSLEDLDRGLSGDVSMTTAMDELAASLRADVVPAAWMAKSFPSSAPLRGWLLSLVERNKQLQEWTFQVRLPPVCTNIALLFNPQAFLTAVLQTSARQTGSPLDRLTLHTEITRKTVAEIQDPAREGAYVHGLQLSGASWDSAGNTLTESKLKEVAQAMPVILVKPVPDANQSGQTDVYECPVYASGHGGSRIYVFTASLPMPSGTTSQHAYIQQGVALLLP